MSYPPTISATVAPSPRSGMKVRAIIGMLVALCLLATTVALGIGSRSRTQAAQEANAQAQSLRDQLKEVDTETATIQTQITQAQGKKEAQQWCDGFTGADPTLDTIHSKAKVLSSMTQTRRDAVAQLCPRKKDFADAFEKEVRGSVVSGDLTCEVNNGIVTVEGNLQLNGAKLSALGSIDVIVDLYITPGEVTDSDTPLRQQTVTIPPGGQGSFSMTATASNAEGSRCTVRPAGLWPTGL